MGVVNIIDKKSNIERIQTRFKSDLEKFKEGQGNPAPQFPSTLHSEDVIEEHQNQIKQNIRQLIEHCTCKTKTIWQANPNIGKTTNESDIFAEKEVTTYQNYGDCDGVGIDLLMLFDQQNVDLREQEEKKENVYPSAIIPLSTRSQYLLPLTRTGEGALVFSANEKKKARALLGDICTTIPQPDSAREKEMMKKAAKTTDQLKTEADRIEYRKKLRVKILQKRQGGKKTHKRRKKRTKRKTRKGRRRKRRKTRRKRH